MSHVVIVESPAKCKTINKYLGSDYTVLASFGHIRDLPSKDGSVRPDEDFAMDYVVSADSKKHIKAISDAVKNAKSLILATDPDREGEAISWHVLEALKEKKLLKAGLKIQRVAFNSITKSAVQEAIAHPRELDMNLVNAQQARRALDYLVGFTLSPVLWRKLPGSRSAGRVQSVALRLICDREEEIEKFREQEYWSIEAEFNNVEGKKFSATLTHLNGEKLDKFALVNENSAKKVETALKSKEYKITRIEKKQVKRNPWAPFTTSTLQQEASRKLGWGAKKTMQVAQKLYEGITVNGELMGLITYMRTDAINVAPEAVFATRDLIEKAFGKEYLPDSPRMYKSKAKNAQEAHEAIRPTNPKLEPFKIEKQLSADEFKLYGLIWKRMITSQMQPAVFNQVSADIETTDGYGRLRATGSTVLFDGFLKVYKEGQDDNENGDDEKTLPALNEGEKAELIEPKAEQHFTQPPPRFTEASLVKRLEELGIGRPSTYASIISVLQEREYVTLKKKRFFSETRGRIVTAFLVSFFPRYVEYNFTAHLEDELDEIANGELNWKDALREFWQAFSANVEGAMQIGHTEVIDKLSLLLEPFLFGSDKTAEEKHKCPSCDNGRLGLKLGKFGAFLGCSNYPECPFTRQLSGSATDGEKSGVAASEDPKILGTDPDTGNEVSLRKGPYGFYIQLGKQEGKIKPKRAPLPKKKDPESLDLETALALLSLPRDVGTHPETGHIVKSNIGRYGPYIQHEKTFVSLKDDDDVLTIGINRAVDLLVEAGNKKSKKAEPVRELGEHPKTGKPVAIYDGRYGPYVKHEKTNASLPRGNKPEDITMDIAVELLEKQSSKKKKKKRA